MNYQHLLRTTNEDYTSSQLARLLGVGRTTIWTWVKQDRFPGSYRIGTRHRIPKSAVIRFLEQCNTPAAVTVAVGVEPKKAMAMGASVGFHCPEQLPMFASTGD